MKIPLRLFLISAFLLAGFIDAPGAEADADEKENFSAHYKELDQKAKDALHNYLLACKKFWVASGGGKVCTLDIARQEKYGLEIPEGVSISGEGADDKFKALAYHRQSVSVFRINFEGSIVENLSL